MEIGAPSFVPYLCRAINRALESQGWRGHAPINKVRRRRWPAIQRPVRAKTQWLIARWPSVIHRRHQESLCLYHLEPAQLWLAPGPGHPGRLVRSGLNMARNTLLPRCILLFSSSRPLRTDLLSPLQPRLAHRSFGAGSPRLCLSDSSHLGLSLFSHVNTAHLPTTQPPAPGPGSGVSDRLEIGLASSTPPATLACQGCIR